MAGIADTVRDARFESLNRLAFVRLRQYDGIDVSMRKISGRIQQEAFKLHHFIDAAALFDNRGGIGPAQKAYFQSRILLFQIGSNR
ncbi:hypothetical protein [Collimonas sp.]|uniref:hypothetical protein n=1 Tax=Collimonas sp. TaxID=1963772 RepID=UPI002D7F430A|nr:hypothetical protein [Collimonas sp.]